MKASVSLSLPVVLVTMLAGCGAGGEDTVSATTTGMFRDAPVSGLWYQSLTGNAYTSSTGTFPYKPGVTYTFYVGAVKLGSFTPTVDDATVTPANLVPEATANRETVILNLTRFLMTLDQNQSASDGIQISSSMDGKALRWPPIDFYSTTVFSSSYATAALFGVTGTGAFDGINAVNGATTYMTESDARNHLASSMSCAYSGAYFANRMNGSAVDSRVALNMDGNGVIKALQYYPTGASVYTFSSPTAFSYNNLLADDAVLTSVDSAEAAAAVKLRYRQTLSDMDSIYVNTTQSTAFSGGEQKVARLGGKPTALRRLSAIVSMPTSPTDNDYAFLIEIDSSNVISGKVIDIHSGETAALTGSFTSGTLTGTASIGSRSLQLSGPLATATNTWTATLRETLDSVATDQAFTAVGCKLNPL